MYTPTARPSSSGLARGLRKVGVMLVGLLALLGWAASPAGAAKPDASTTTTPVVSITLSTGDATTGLGGAVPQVLALPGDPISLVLTASAPFNKDVTFTLDDGGLPGEFTPSSVTLPRDQLSVGATVSYSAVASGIIVTPVVGGNPNATKFTVGTPQPFDVVRVLQRASKGATSIGADTCTATSPDTNCGVAVLPNSFSSPSAALTVGAPATCGGKPCAASLVQFTAGMDTGLYTQTNPATIIFRCDKTVCSNGGVNKFQVHFTYGSIGDLSLVAPACLVKGQSNDPSDQFGGACVDYVNSTRDNAGDTLLYFNFLHDLRGSGF